MHPQIITVPNINKAIEDVGIKPYANTLVQEMGGDYFYVEADYFNREPTQDAWPDLAYSWMPDRETKGHWRFLVWPIPLPLAWFVIDALRLKAEAMNMGLNEGERRTGMAVYLTPGKELFGHKIKALTEIPAELGPVVVERL